jgi:hypothetical protein
MKIKNKIEEYWQLKSIVRYYEDNMFSMLRCRKYDELGLLLLSSVRPGDDIYMIATRTQEFNRVVHGVVKKIEFIGGNDSKIYAERTDDLAWLGSEKLITYNRNFGKTFFCDEEQARIALNMRLMP